MRGWGRSANLHCRSSAGAGVTGRMNLQRTIKATIRHGEQSGYVAECLEIPVVTQGKTLDEVTRNLHEAVELHLEGGILSELGLAPSPTIVVTQTTWTV